MIDKSIKKIFLVGMMGVGKSTVGKKLAAHLGWKHLDTDALIEQKSGQSIADIFQTKGEEYFRFLEADLLIDIEQFEHVVVSTGGGFVQNGQVMSKLRDQGICLYLKASPKFLASRLMQSKNTRPLIANTAGREELERRIQDILEERDFIYEQADLTFDAVDLNAGSIVDRIRSLGQ